MPDTSLTWKNLKDHFRRYGVIYVVVMGLAAVLSSLLWTMTTPRVPEDQRVLIYVADAYTDVTPLKPITEDVLREAQGYDPTLRAVDVESLRFADPDEDYTGVMVLMTRLAAGEGDVFLAGAKAMDALVQMGACEPLEPYYENGWLDQLEPYYGEVTDPETGETTRFMAGLKLDSLESLLDMRVMYNEGACLAVAVNGSNMETSMKVAELLVERLQGEAGDDA